MKLKLNGYNPIPAILKHKGDPATVGRLFLVEMKKAGIEVESEEDFDTLVRIYKEVIDEFIERNSQNGN